MVMYRIDGYDRIVSVNAAWEEFARANDAPELADSVVGQSLWGYISSGDVRQLYHDLLTSVRQSQRVARLPFRCDSPEVQRSMELTIIPHPGDVVEFQSRLLAEQNQRADREAIVHAQDLLRVCSWCKKAFIGGDWVEIDEAVTRLGLFTVGPASPMISHGICPTCVAKVRAEIYRLHALR
jgi:hypothetical protein